MQQLRTTHVRIALPAYVPSGFVVDHVEVDPRRSVGTPSYELRYRKGDACFSYESGRGGLGGDDMSAFKERTIRSPFLGGDVRFYYRGQSFFLDPLDQHAPDGRWYDVSSVIDARVKCSATISLDEAAKVAASIRLLP